MKEIRRYSGRKLESVLKDWGFLNLWSEEEKQEFVSKYDCKVFGHRNLLAMSKTIVKATNRNYNGLSELEKLEFVASLIASDCVTSYIEF